MSRRERQRVFVLAAVVVVTALLALSVRGGSDHGERAPPAAAAKPSVVAGESASRVSGEEHGRELDDASGAHNEGRFAEPRRVTRRFIAAFGRYQAGRLAERTERRLRTLATPQLVTYLLAHPPRDAPARYARPRVARLDLTGPRSGPVKAAALIAYRHRRRSLFEVRLDRLDGRWRVSQLYPSEG